VHLAQRLRDSPLGALAREELHHGSGLEVHRALLVEKCHGRAAGEHDEELVGLDIRRRARRVLPHANLTARVGAESDRTRRWRPLEHFFSGHRHERKRQLVRVDLFTIIEIAMRHPDLQTHESNPSPTASSVRSTRLRRPSLWSARSIAQRDTSTPIHATGSGGNGSGIEFTSSSDVRSVSMPLNRSSMTFAANRLEPTPSPVNPAAYATRSANARPKNAVNRVLVSITPAQRCVNRTPSSCGNVVKKWL